MSDSQPDYCAEAEQLRQIYREFITGEGISEARFGEDATKFRNYDKPALLAEIKRVEDLCAASQGQKPRRRAKATRGIYRHKY